MKWITHIALAFFVVKVVEIALMIDLFDDYVAYAVVSAFAVLPDIDLIIGIKHRTWTHTIWFSLTALPLALIDWKLALAGWIALMSHLIGDMMTHSGVKLLYPYRETVFYMVPPRWRIKTGSSAEFMILGVLIIGSMLISSVSTQTETEKLFSLSRDHVVEARLSVFENGARYDYDNVEIVWTDGKSKIGFIDENKLVRVGKDQILNVEIVSTHEKGSVKHAKTKVKRLRSTIWKHRIIVAYSINNWKEEFTGTGYELYRKLENDLDENIEVWYYEVR